MIKNIEWFNSLSLDDKAIELQKTYPYEFQRNNEEAIGSNENQSASNRQAESSQNVTNQEGARTSESTAELSNQVDYNIVPFKATKENSAQYQKAVQMFANNESLEKIWGETGFFLRQNTNDKTWEWAYRIDQNKMEVLLPNNLKVGDKFKLSEVIDYPEFFSLFPKAKDITVKIVDNPDRNLIAGLSETGNILLINKAYYDNSEQAKSEKGKKEIFAHELQHYIHVFLDKSPIKTTPDSETRRKFEVSIRKSISNSQRLVLNPNISEVTKRFEERNIKSLQEQLDYLSDKKVSEQIKKVVDSELNRLAYFDSLQERESNVAETDYEVSPYFQHQQFAIENDIPSIDFEAETKPLRSQAQEQISNQKYKRISVTEANKLIELLKKAIPKTPLGKKVNVTFDLEFTKQRARELGENITDLEMKTSNGNVYGFKLSVGTIYINPEKLNANTPIHEFSHLWEQVLPLAWKKGLGIFKETKTGKDLFDQLKKEGNYSNLTEEQLWSEAMNTLIGNLGEERYQQKPRGKMAEFISWVKDTFAKFINAVTGRKDLNKELDPKELDLKQFTDKVLDDLLGGKEIKAEAAGSVDNGIQYSKRDLTKGAKQLIRNLFNLAKENQVNPKPYGIGKLNEIAKEKLSSISNLPFREFTEIIVNPSELRHIFNDHFGANEKDTGNNIPLTDSDIENISDIINNPNKIAFLGFDKKTQANKFLFAKESKDGTFAVVEVYGNKGGKLSVKSMYHSKKGIDKLIKDELTPTLNSSETAFGVLAQRVVDISSSDANIPNLIDFNTEEVRKILGQDNRPQFSIVGENKVMPVRTFHDAIQSIAKLIHLKKPKLLLVFVLPTISTSVVCHIITLVAIFGCSFTLYRHWNIAKTVI